MTAVPTPVQAVVGTAQAMGLDPYLALAVAEQESGLNPTAVGDNGTSFGLFQLHQGGELGNLTPTQAENPYVNAQVAESQLVQAAQANPGGDPGAIAAAAQRPADPQAYAAGIDQIYGQISGAGPVPAMFTSGTAIDASTYNTTPTDSWWQKILKGLGNLTLGIHGADPGGNIPGGVGQVAQGAAQGAAGTLTSGWGKAAMQIVFVIAGLGIVALGLARLFPGVTRTVTQAVR